MLQVSNNVWFPFSARMLLVGTAWGCSDIPVFEIILVLLFGKLWSRLFKFQFQFNILNLFSFSLCIVFS